MGQGQSTPRTITLEEDSSGMVKVSQDAANRLIGKSDTGEHKPPAASQPESTQSRITVNKPLSDDQLRTELDRIRSQYEKKIAELEKRNRQGHQTTVEEFAKAVEQVESKFVKPPVTPPCDELQNKVIQCYKDNPRQVLNCSQTVRAYSACVAQERGNTLKNSSSEFYLVS